MNTFYLNFLKRKLSLNLKKKLKKITCTNNLPHQVNTLLVSNKHELSETMLYPFYWYEEKLKTVANIRFCDISITDLVLETKKSNLKIETQYQIKHIFFQAEFEMEKSSLIKTMKYLKLVFPNAKIAYMDWYAPLHIRPASIANDYIDLYIKKHSYKNFSNYNQPTIGDTNLSDYYAKRHDLNLAPMQFTAPSNLEDKMIIWSNFGFSPQMIDLFLNDFKGQNKRPIDLHARLAVNGVDWYKAMRQEAKDAINNLSIPNLNIAANGRVKRHQFFQEMTQSKLCFSPFGYGEVCWRDYEAFATGALLLKPNMDHIILNPDFFIPNETYISLEWDLSDLTEKVEYYINNPNESERITRNAFDVMKQSITNDSMLELIINIMQKH